MKPTHSWHIYADPSSAARAAAEYMAEIITSVIETNGNCSVFLPGGNTPGECLGYLAQMQLDWNRIHWYLGDERCYPRGHAERNDVLVEKNLWSKIPVAHRYPIDAEMGAEEAARRYREIVDRLESIDIILLGVGEDGHTASLFPDNEALHDARSVVPVYNAPKPPAERVSVGLSTLRRAQYRVVLALAKGKAQIIARVKSAEQLPINCLGSLVWFVDRDAMPE